MTELDNLVKEAEAPVLLIMEPDVGFKVIKSIKPGKVANTIRKMVQAHTGKEDHDEVIEELLKNNEYVLILDVAKSLIIVQVMHDKKLDDEVFKTADLSMFSPVIDNTVNWKRSDKKAIKLFLKYLGGEDAIKSARGVLNKLGSPSKYRDALKFVISSVKEGSVGDINLPNGSMIPTKVLEKVRKIANRRQHKDLDEESKEKIKKLLSKYL